MNPGQFQSELDVTPLADGVNWRLNKPLVYVTSWGMQITVPAGFTTDFASTPRPIWWLLPPVGTYDGPAVVHDWLYRNHYTRWLCDGVIWESMRAIKVPAWMVWTIYLALRVGGWWAWRHEPAAARIETLQ